MLRITTYNTQLRSYLMEAVEDIDPFPEDPEDRAKEIAKRILASSKDYDVLALNEVFAEDARSVLTGTLSLKYPHVVEKLEHSGPDVEEDQRPDAV